MVGHESEQIRLYELVVISSKERDAEIGLDYLIVNLADHPNQPRVHFDTIGPASVY